MLDECFLLPRFCLQEVLLGRQMVAFTEELLLHFPKAYKLLIPPFMCGETLIGTAATAAAAAVAAAAAAAPVLTQTRSRLQLSAGTLAAGHDLKNWCHLFRCLPPACFKDVELIESLLCVAGNTPPSQKVTSV